MTRTASSAKPTFKSPLRSTFKAALVAAALGTATLAAPAHAGGSVSFTVAPTSADEAQAMRAGLAIYSIVNGFKGGSGIKQAGFGNAAGLAQNGGGNLGIVHQQGSGHNGTLAQNGNGNAHGLFQFGKNTNGHVAQNGNGQTGATFVFGF